jgi:hypothetical protein
MPVTPKAQSRKKSAHPRRVRDVAEHPTRLSCAKLTGGLHDTSVNAEHGVVTV